MCLLGKWNRYKEINKVEPRESFKKNTSTSHALPRSTLWTQSTLWLSSRICGRKTCKDARRSEHPTKLTRKVKLRFFCLLWIDKARCIEKTNIWVSVRWKTKTKTKGSTRLAYTGLLGGLEHLKIETRSREVRRQQSLKARTKGKSCLLWIDKARSKAKTYIWVSVWWKTKT